MTKERQWAPWIDDPDEPELMTPQESKAAAQKAKEFMDRRRKSGHSSPAASET
jgi:hypothetical protein